MQARATITSPDYPFRRLYLPVSILLYILAFPGLVPGMGLLAFIAIVPAFLWLEGARPLPAALFGFGYGILSYSGITYWLVPYHPAALGVSAGLGAIWFTPLFLVLSILLSSRRPILAAAVPFVWVAAEIGRSIGFLGFPYGTLPYALYRYDAALRLASAGGVATVGLTVATVNLGFYLGLRGLIGRRGPEQRTGTTRRPWIRALPAVLAAVIVAATAAAGYPRPSESVTPGSPSTPPAAGNFRVALIQPDIPKAQTTAADYDSAAVALVALSKDALSGFPDLVAWHETAVVPPIEWHLRHRPDRAIYETMVRLKAFMADYPVPLLIGNGWADPNDPDRAIGGNAAVLYERGAEANRYLKMRLVPFSEYFPYEKAFPGLTRWLVDKFGYFWIPGQDYTIFDSEDMRFAAPICFEDSFGEHMADFNEPDFFVVQTNDAWAKSAAMQEQHLSMSIYRAAETATVVLRVANTGSTAAVAPNGYVSAELPPFKPGILYADVRRGTAMRTLYERGGRLAEPAIGFAGLALALLACAGAIIVRMRRRTGVSD